MDRNVDSVDYIIDYVKSLSARRAWIEISPAGCWRDARRSLSARRAWIEIELLPWGGWGARRRSPQGERG